MKLKCIKNVVMQMSGEVACTEGKEYAVENTSAYSYIITNDQGNPHSFSKFPTEDRTHFVDWFELVE